MKTCIILFSNGDTDNNETCEYRIHKDNVDSIPEGKVFLSYK